MCFDDRRMVEKEELLSILKARNIPFAYEDHERVLNMAESSELRLSLEGTRCKNLLLQDKQGHVYLVVTTSEKALDLSAAAKSIGSKRLSFASAERMQGMLGVLPGSLSPLALINDVEPSIDLVVDAELQGEPTFLFHPLDSAATLSISRLDLEAFLSSTGHKIEWATLATRLAA